MTRRGGVSKRASETSSARSTTGDADTMTIAHVNVPDAVSGRGIAAALTEAALSHARSCRWRVIAQCAYAAWYLREHPEWADVLAR